MNVSTVFPEDYHLHQEQNDEEQQQQQQVVQQNLDEEQANGQSQQNGHASREFLMNENKI